MATRPTGVTVIAVLCFIGAAFLTLGGIAMFLGGGFLATILSQQNQASGGGALGFITGAGLAVVGVVLLVIAALEALVGWGLLKLKNWARIVMLVLTGLSVVGALLALANFTTSILISSVIRLAIGGLIIWYLLKPEVKAAFQ